MNSSNSGDVRKHQEQCTKPTHQYGKTHRTHRRIFDATFGWLYHPLLATLPTIHLLAGSLSISVAFHTSLPLIPSLYSFLLSLPVLSLVLSYHVWPVIWPMSPNWSPCSSLSLFEGFSCHHTYLLKPWLWWLHFLAQTPQMVPIAYKKRDWVSDRHLGAFHHLPSPAHFCLLSSHTGLLAWCLYQVSSAKSPHL